jgi:hypothetical protein
MGLLKYYPQDYLRNRSDVQSIYFILISFVGLFFLSVLFLWSPKTSINYNYQKTLVLLIFLGICLLGMLAAVYPSHCIYLLNYKKDFKNQRPANSVQANPNNNNKVKYKGHHPDCGKFNSHIFILRGKKYCAGCTGLFLGAVIAVIGILIYYSGFFSSYLSEINPSTLFWIGFLAVFFSLSQLIFINLKNNVIKFSSNLLLVLGSFLILIGIDINRGAISLEIYFLFLIIFWILTRIRISQINHRVTCRECGQTSACQLKII